MVAWSYTCSIVEKYVNNRINVALSKDLKFAWGSGHQKGCSLWVIVTWWKSGRKLSPQMWISVTHNTRGELRKLVNV